MRVLFQNINYKFVYVFQMRFLILLGLLAAVGAALVEKQSDQNVQKPEIVVLTPVEVVQTGPLLKRRARQFGIGGFGGGYDNSNFGAYNQGGSFGGLGGYGGYENQGFDYNQQQGGFGGGGFGGGGFGGGGFGGGYGNGGYGGGFGF